MIVHYHHKGPFGWDNHGKVEIDDERLLKSSCTRLREAIIDDAVWKCRVHCHLVWNINQLYDWEIEVLHPKNTLEQDIELINNALGGFVGPYTQKAAKAALKRLEKICQLVETTESHHDK